VNSRISTSRRPDVLTVESCPQGGLEAADFVVPKRERIRAGGFRFIPIDGRDMPSLFRPI